AINHMRIYEVDAVDAVIQDNGMFYHHDGQGLKQINKDSFLRLERDEIFRRSGGIHLVRCSFIRSDQNIWNLKTGHIIVDEWAQFRVSNQFNFKIANYLADELSEDKGGE
ncbi:MAG: hypothetical protein MJK18_05370, partial [Bdellovibrionales bacterium]|nr:hypothetical protein [Bdellovibrionales bacterium]